MSCGTAVAASNTSSLPDVGGEAALYFDPMDVEMMAATIRRLLSDVALREGMQKLGLAHAARFSWRRAAAETALVYEKVM
jgi:glycosyltransferase involved in cell wall biosynthesis